MRKLSLIILLLFTANMLTASDVNDTDKNKKRNEKKEESKVPRYNPYSYLQGDEPGVMYWLGGKIGYDFRSLSTDNITGSTFFKIAPLRKFIAEPFNLVFFCNLSKVVSTNFADSLRGVSDIIQSTQGLNIGMQPIYTINPYDLNNNYIRLVGSVSYKLNGFKRENVVTNLHQFRTSFGFELEGLRSKKGYPVLWRTEAVYSAFDKYAYSHVYSNNLMQDLYGLETEVIVPLSKFFSVYAIADFFQIRQPVYQAGLIIYRAK